MGKILVTGGCGYIGSHTLVDLIDHGFEVISVDNLSNAREEVLQGIARITGQQVENYNCDLSDPAATTALFRELPQIDAIIHFAAHKSVGESVAYPLRYFRNNLDSLMNILQAMEDQQIPNLIFSSSCSVYGNAEKLPVDEQTPLQEAESPYARTKQLGETILRDLTQHRSWPQCVLLRYFNPAGAHASAHIGEDPSNRANNLVPVITETAIGKRERMTVFGTDYPTPDGSCIRDYLHVMDLANAHTRSLQFLLAQKQEEALEIFNLGMGRGVSVLEAIAAFERSTGQHLRYERGPRRAGDVVAIYADASRAAARLGWQAERDIDEIMRSAWEWEQVRSGKRVPS